MQGSYRFTRTVWRQSADTVSGLRPVRCTCVEDVGVTRVGRLHGGSASSHEWNGTWTTLVLDPHDGGVHVGAARVGSSFAYTAVGSFSTKTSLHAPSAVECRDASSVVAASGGDMRMGQAMWHSAGFSQAEAEIHTVALTGSDRTEGTEHGHASEKGKRKGKTTYVVHRRGTV